MKLSEILKDADKAYIYMERYVNNGSPSGFSKNTTSPMTQPVGGDETFPVKIIKFDSSIDVKAVGEKKYYNLDDNCLLCHPDNLEQPIFKNIKELWTEVGQVSVSPTASGRTVKCVGENQFFIKLDYIGMLGRITRNLDLQRVQSAYEVTTIIKSAIKSGVMNPKFSLLLEDSGKVAYLPMENGEFYQAGFVLRDNKVFSASNNIDEQLYLIPAFSLFGTDVKAPDDKLLIVQIYEKQSKPINQFAFEDVFKPIVDTYFDTLINCGLCLEAHAQNMLVAIDNQYRIRYIVARDMESVDKDLPLREYLGLSNDVIVAQNYKCLRKSAYNYQIMHSFMYDFKLGFYLLDPLMKVFGDTYQDFDGELIVQKIKALARSYIEKLPSDYFPSEWYNYDNIIHKQGEKRPYIAHPNPRYR